MPDPLTNARIGGGASPFVSVIVPVHNGGPYLGACLDALGTAVGEDFEIIVVDDGSQDQSADIARERGVRLLRHDSRRGPAATRNRGVSVARGQVLLFVDADVLVRPTTVAQVATHFREKPALAALFGSYDDEPAAPTFVSQYKNLFHHFMHQHGRQEAATFWAGCGAIRRESFLRAGGFNESRYREASIEDIELGTRLRRAGQQILLDRNLQVRHLKKWTLSTLLRTDIFWRAVPWARLMLEQRNVPDDLNLSVRERVAAAATVVMLWLLIFAPVFPLLLLAAALLLCLVIILNRRLYLFFWRRRGPLFLLGAVPLHLLYYCYSSAAFAWCWLAHLCGGRRRRAGARSPARQEI